MLLTVVSCLFSSICNKAAVSGGTPVLLCLQDALLHAAPSTSQQTATEQNTPVSHLVLLFCKGVYSPCQDQTLEVSCVPRHICWLKVPVKNDTSKGSRALISRSQIAKGLQSPHQATQPLVPWPIRPGGTDRCQTQYAQHNDPLGRACGTILWSYASKVKRLEMDYCISQQGVKSLESRLD